MRPLVVLEQLAAAGQPFTLSQLAARARIPKATLLRLVKSLESQGYVIHVPDSRGTDRALAPGPRAARLALATLANNTFRRACRSLLRALVNETGESCNLTALDGDAVLYLERVETAEPLRLQMETGTRVPMHCTANGKLFLARMPLSERRLTLNRLTLARRTHRTLTDRSLLEAELERLAKLDIGIDNEEFVHGMVAVAVPVVDPATGKVLAGIATHAPTARVMLDELLDAVPQMRATAKKLAQLMCALTAQDPESPVER